jgi:uncharacterized membrane protein YphA (DoxX/SURF4 family)
MAQKSSLLNILLRMALGLFFFITGVIKAGDLDAFTEDVFNYQLLFPPYDAYAAYLVAWLEIIAGAVLAIGLWGRRGALVLIAGMLVTFIGALSSAAARGLNINCGCFGASDEPTNFPFHIGLNSVLLLITFYLLWQEFRRGRGHLFKADRLVLPE